MKVIIWLYTSYTRQYFQKLNLRGDFELQTNNKEITKLLIELLRNKLRLCPTRDVNNSLDDSSLSTNL